MSRVPVIAEEVTALLLLRDMAMRDSGPRKPLDMVHAAWQRAASGLSKLMLHLAPVAPAYKSHANSAWHCWMSHLGDVFGALSSAGVRLPVQLDLLLLEVSPVLLIHEHQIEVVLHAELVVDQLVGGRQVVGRQEQPASEAGPNISAFMSALSLAQQATEALSTSRMPSAVLAVTGPAAMLYRTMQCKGHS